MDARFTALQKIANVPDPATADVSITVENGAEITEADINTKIADFRAQIDAIEAKEAAADAAQPHVDAINVVKAPFDTQSRTLTACGIVGVVGIVGGGIGVMGTSAKKALAGGSARDILGAASIGLLALIAIAAFGIGFCPTLSGPTIGGGGLVILSTLLLTGIGTVGMGVQYSKGGRRRLSPSESVLEPINGAHYRRLAPLESLLEQIETAKWASLQQ